MNKKLFEKYIKQLPKKAKVLDAGCGSGNNSRYVKSIRPDLVIHAVDIDGSLKKEVPDFVRFYQESIENLKSFKEGLFDCILCFHVIEHVLNSKKVVSEFKRVLKNKGVVFAESPHWVSTIMPIGCNFYDDPTHLRPHSKQSFSCLF